MHDVIPEIQTLKIQIAEAQLRASQATLHQKARAFNLAKSLYNGSDVDNDADNNAISSADFDTAECEYKVAVENSTIASINVALVKLGQEPVELHGD